ncbi:hypothetical protein [Actinotalea sp. K2]|uniref:hypothetical protein n=1 Tax=Actinotalea sp. K2 TaxID=2939438 RepID=UPI00201748F0|nr:hypothetical protein [Actinotalea sp. K2]MCL3863015.1 hypothetical protein [Actinotalea sp. K2]
MAFETHTDMAMHPAIVKAGSAGTGLWLRCGAWTASNGETGVVPVEVAREYGDPQLIDEVVAAGLWTVVEGGYRMEFGPSSDWPLPIWRYSSD